MANWADTRERRYNDYVGMPVDTYAAVGMYKQGMYEQGIQQIQTALSTVAGLEIARDVDKNYLNSKVSEVTSKINNIGGGDWSNKNLVSKATGIATTVAKDQYVQDAVYSTAALKQLSSSQKELKEKHPELYPVSAEWYDSQELQRYMSSNELGDKYRGPKEATRHFGKQRDESIRAALKELHPSIVQTVTPSGEYTYTYDKTTTVTPEQIQNVVMGVIGSNSEFQKSIQIDSSFSYKDADVTDLIQTIPGKKALIENQRIDADKNIDDIIAANPQMSSADKQKLLDQKASNQKAVEARLAEYDNIVEKAKAGDIDQINSLKQMNFSDNMLNGYIANFKQFSRETDVKENIVTKAQLDWIRAGLDPETKLPPTPGSKYDAYARSLKKNADGSSMGLISSTPATGEANKMQDIPTLETHIASLETTNNDLYNSFIGDLKLKNNYSQEQAQAYMDAQAENLRSGKPADKDYVQYYKRQQENTAIITANREVIMEANKKAEEGAPVKNLGIKKIDGLTFAVDYSNNAFISLVEKIKNDAKTELEAEGIRFGKDVGGLNDFALSKKIKETISKYHNNPYYKFVKEMSDKDFTTQYDKITNPVKSQLSQQEKIKNEYIKNRINTVTGVSMTIPENSDEQKSINNSIIEAYDREDLSREGISVPDNISATGVYRDPATGDIYATFSSGKTGSKTVQTKKLPAGTVIASLPPVSSYEKIRTAIEISPYKKTTPLVTSNGKINYKVGKMGDSYYAQIQINGLWNNINPIESNDIGTVIEQLERAANNPLVKDLPPKEAASAVVRLLNNEK